MFEWTIILRNERMGFAKTFKPVASTMDAGIFNAKLELARQGYSTDDFTPISAVRGRIV